MVSFAVQKLVCLIRSHWFIFAFISITFSDWPKKTFVWLMSENTLPVSSSRSFMVSCLMFKSLSYVEFIIVHDVRLCFNFIDSHAAVQFSQHRLLKRLFPILYSRFLCWRLIDRWCLGLFLGSLFCSIGLYVCFGTSTALSCSFLVLSEVWESYTSCLFCFFFFPSQNYFGNLGFFYGSI